ncbi:hypothetical protein OPV22_014621 [Ensete ventricosum]|uniref:Uncharacterized protein n=1 Tax=Ensete ventricosum TaxID=4639 RepID=A0AAV8R1Z8_ENSVE|nr:hypothetical protein OPV22_014621 [Ensete ventricosum]
MLVAQRSDRWVLRLICRKFKLDLICALLLDRFIRLNVRETRGCLVAVLKSITRCGTVMNPRVPPSSAI